MPSRDDELLRVFAQDMQRLQEAFARDVSAMLFGERKPATKEAQDRADTLLRRYLTKAQRAQLDMHGFFTVKGGKTGNVYEIHGKKFLANIIDKKNRIKYCICFAERHVMPIADHLLAQMLLIECNEREFLRIANATPYHFHR